MWCICLMMLYIKVKFTLEQAMKTQRGSRCTALLFLQPQQKMEVRGQCHALGTLSLGKTWYSLYGSLGGSLSQSGWVRKISPSPGFDPQTIQPIASRYTDCAIPALDNKMLGTLLYFIVLYRMILSLEVPNYCL